MRSHIVRRQLLVIAGIALIAACTDTTAATDISGQYRSATVDGSFFPVRYDPHNGADVWVQGAFLDARTPDTLRVTTVILSGWTSGGVVDTLVGTYTWGYQRVGDSLVADGQSLWGKVVGDHIRVSVAYPVPPSEGYSSVTHAYVFVK